MQKAVEDLLKAFCRYRQEDRADADRNGFFWPSDDEITFWENVLAGKPVPPTKRVGRNVEMSAYLVEEMPKISEDKRKDMACNFAKLSEMSSSELEACHSFNGVKYVTTNDTACLWTAGRDGSVVAWTFTEVTAT
jgi:hypothetical protein